MRLYGKYLILCAGICTILNGCAGNTAQQTAAADTSADAALSEEAAHESSEGKDNAHATAPGIRTGDNRGGGGMAMETDEQVLAVLAKNADKFQQMTYKDEETGISLEYSLYVPEGYSESDSLPMIMFIPDATGAGKSAKEIVEQYYGATVWVSGESQEKHPSFVLVPAFSEVVVDDNFRTSEQIETAVSLIKQLCEDYPIDQNRLYTTGQSMGCMTSLYLNSKYPALFAASLFVGGQWDISALKGLEEQTFFYITAGGDEKASGGQRQVMEMFDADGVSYAYGQWSAQDSAVQQDAAVQELLRQNCRANMVRFETGTVLKDGNTMEHMASFNYAYKITAVRDWLFEQSQNNSGN
ncbi:MAG: hypothetical protein LUH21_16205 [Clostridiales bacterium]|nr:hypothetical protein [Clostridiales bacterium]